ncbi:hypothetical protein [Aquisalinus flavus]|uniref:Ribosomal protein L7/L12 C-terminal domain-containing protein n=1 Tax=Aquisalinus flavus TaxID=1526572 RepID=A0A8J2Y2X6_9PROT|nr:hypothetical protein [Aquisalinus flavus]MBD0426803.1 hypothetical protein [Aquisalinus flavus]UNE46652.1 hypothetical protein FF099_00565 [Aquisalinus flavus]GGC96137.1 hypothetical protein GCM10011342_01160 [Aquisalinus flavus]
MEWFLIGGGLIVLVAIWFLFGGKGQDESAILADVESTLASLSPEQRDRVTALTADGRKIEAINYLREDKGVDLAVAKRIVDGSTPSL